MTSEDDATGPMRNAQMAAYADALIAIPTGGPGTPDMVNKAAAQGLKIFVYTWGTSR